jgi:predicted transcriptional regulator of viral defense system
MIIFAVAKLHINETRMNEKYNTIRDLVEDLPKRGKITFTQKEIEEHFPAMPVQNIRNTLQRLASKKKIQSVGRGFFVVVPVEYGLKGIVPPVEYIDRMMKYLNREYYVGLLNAAALHGAAHQRPQEFTLIVDTDNLRDKGKKGIKINFVTRKKIPDMLVKQVMTKSGYVNVSNPELTAMDLILYVRETGGINRAATVLNELAETMDFSYFEDNFFDYFNAAVVQRLGYILDDVLEQKELADMLYQKVTSAGIAFRKYPLKTVPKETKLSGYPVNNKWKIIVNEQIEIDE